MADMKPIPIAETVDQPTHRKLGFCVLRAHLRHAVATLFGRQHVSHYRMISSAALGAEVHPIFG